MTSNRTFYKILTHDFCPPLQGGKPIWDGVTLPFQLPTVALDTRTVIEYSYGWNFVEDLAEGFKIAGLWPTGRPSVVLAVTPSADALACGTKRRASSLRFDRLATEAEIRAAVVRLSEDFGQHAERMAEEQQAWRTALARPAHDVATVETGLVAALRGRGLRDWTTQSFESAWAALASLASRAAQAVCFAALQSWTKDDPLMLTTGIRDAYASGLELAIPVAAKTLGYVMVKAQANLRD